MLDDGGSGGDGVWDGKISQSRVLAMSRLKSQNLFCGKMIRWQQDRLGVVERSSRVVELYLRGLALTWLRLWLLADVCFW